MAVPPTTRHCAQLELLFFCIYIFISFLFKKTFPFCPVALNCRCVASHLFLFFMRQPLNETRPIQFSIHSCFVFRALLPFCFPPLKFILENDVVIERTAAHLSIRVIVNPAFTVISPFACPLVQCLSNSSREREAPTNNSPRQRLSTNQSGFCLRAKAVPRNLCGCNFVFFLFLFLFSV